MEMNYNCATSWALGALLPGLRAQAIAARGSVRIVRTERASGAPFSGLCAACQHAAWVERASSAVRLIGRGG